MIVMNPFWEGVSRWNIEGGAGGDVIRETSTGKVLDIYGNNREPGATLILYPLKPTDNDNQMWMRERV